MDTKTDRWTLDIQNYEFTIASTRLAVRAVVRKTLPFDTDLQ